MYKNFGFEFEMKIEIAQKNAQLKAAQHLNNGIILHAIAYIYVRKIYFILNTQILTKTRMLTQTLLSITIIVIVMIIFISIFMVIRNFRGGRRLNMCENVLARTLLVAERVTHSSNTKCGEKRKQAPWCCVAAVAVAKERCTSMKIYVNRELLIVMSDKKGKKVCSGLTYKNNIHFMRY